MGRNSAGRTGKKGYSITNILEFLLFQSYAAVVLRGST